MCDVYLAVVVIESMVGIRIKLVVINPNPVALLDRNCIISLDLANDQVTNDNIRSFVDIETSSFDDSGASNTNDGSVVVF